MFLTQNVSHLFIPLLIRRVLILLCCLLFSIQAVASNYTLAEAISLNDNFNTIKAFSAMRYVEDTEHSLNSQDIFSLETQRWQHIPNNSANFGFSDSVFWFKLSLNNESKKIQELYIHLDYALLDDIHLYQVDHNQIVREYEAGDRFPFADRPVNFPTFLFPVTIKPETSSDIYIRIESQGTVQAPVSIWNKEYFLLDSQSFLFLYGCFLSAMLIMSAYHFCLFLTIHDKHYLLYSVFILLATGVHSSLDGFAYQWFWPNLPNWHQISAIFFISTGCFFTILFTQSLLSIPKKGAIHIGITFLLIMTACSALMSLVLSYRHAAMLNAFTTIISMLGVILVCIAALRYSPGVARYFIVAWGTYFGGIVLKSSSNIGVINSSQLGQ